MLLWADGGSGAAAAERSTLVRTLHGLSESRTSPARSSLLRNGRASIKDSIMLQKLQFGKSEGKMTFLSLL